MNADPRDFAVHLHVGDWKTGANLLASHRALETIRALRGDRMRDPLALFDEVSAGLQFPLYFGNNWPALDESLRELDSEWLPVDRPFTVVMINAEQILSESDADERRVFARILRKAHATYAEPIQRGEWWDRPALPFSVHWVTAEQHVDDTVREWESVGLRIQVLQQPG